MSKGLEEAVSPRLTIVIPTYNRAKLLARALDSALAQTSDQICIYVSDNASTDGTWDLVQSYSDTRLRVVRRPENCTRIEHAKLILPEIDTEFIITLSDDDYLEPTFCESALALFDRHNEVSFVYTGYVEHYDAERFLPPFGPETEAPLDLIMEYYASNRQIAWCACICRTDDMKRIGVPAKETIFGDMHFWTRIAFKGPVGCVGERLSHYTALRPGGDNESRALPVSEWARQAKRTQEDVMEMVRLHGGNELYQKNLARNMRRHLCLSTTTQFVFGRIGGAGRLDCLNVVRGIGLRGWTFGSVARVGAAVILTRPLLRWLIRKSARAGSKGDD